MVLCIQLNALFLNSDHQCLIIKYMTTTHFYKLHRKIFKILKIQLYVLKIPEFNNFLPLMDLEL